MHAAWDYKETNYWPPIDRTLIHDLPRSGRMIYTTELHQKSCLMYLISLLHMFWFLWDRRKSALIVSTFGHPSSVSWLSGISFLFCNNCIYSLEVIFLIPIRFGNSLWMKSHFVDMPLQIPIKFYLFTFSVMANLYVTYNLLITV